MDATATTCPADLDAKAGGSHTRARVAVGVFLLVLVLVGGGLRMHRLGALGLHGDEGYQYQAVQAVMTHGVPRLESGYIYLRAPHFIYLQAGVARVMGNDVVALRLPAVFFGVLCIPLAFLLGRDLVDLRVGALLAVMLACSAWEIELSRYARFYTLLQACCLAGVWCFFRGYICGQRGYKVGYWAMVLLAVMTHQLGALLGCCFLVLLPLDGYAWRARLGFAAQFVVVGALFLLYGTIERKAAAALAGAEYVPLERSEMLAMTQPADVPSGFHVGVLPDLATPHFMLAQQLWEAYPLLMPAIVGVALLLVLAIAVLTFRRKEWGVGLVAAAAVALSALQLGAMVCACVLLLLAMSVKRRADLARPAVVLGVGGALALLGMAVLATTMLEGHGIEATILDAMRYPDVGRFLLGWIYRGWPVIGLLAMGGGVLACWRARQPEDRCTGRWLALGMLALPVLAASWVGGKHNESRYFFFLYPMILLLVAVFLSETSALAGRRRRSATAIVLGVLLAGLMLLSADFRPTSVWAVSSRGYTDTRDANRSPLNMPFYEGFHQDQASPSRYVHDHRGQGERVLVVGPPHRSVNYAVYSGGVDYVVGRPEHYTRMTRDEHGRLRDPDTGAELIWQPDRLREILSSAGEGRGLWVLADHGLWRDWPIQLSDEMRSELFRQIDPAHAKVGEDGVTFAVHFFPGAAHLPDPSPLTHPTP